MTNKRTLIGRTKARLLIILALATGIAGGYGCQKAALEPPAPPPSPAAAMRAAFETAGYARALVRPLGDTTELCWVPTWENSYDKTGTDGQRYTYVPLATKVRSIRTQQWRPNVALVGARRFLVVRHGSGPDAFSLATYLDAPAQGDAAKRGASAGPAQPRRFADFSGNLLVQGLSTPQFARFAYRNGQVVHQGAGPVKGQPGAPTSTTNAYSCVDLYTCYWIAYCNSSTEASTNVTMTSGVNGCAEPFGEACYSVYGVSWSYNGADIRQQCTYEPDPPTDPDPNPGGAGGGDTATYEYIDPSVVFTPAPNPPDVTEYNCAQLKNTHPDDEIQYGTPGDIASFTRDNAGRTRESIISQRGYQHIATGIDLSKGPNMRYIRDPLNPSVIIDLRHMLVVAYYGPRAGNSVEIFQGIGNQPSAYDHQDYFSNELGYSFYNTYGSIFATNPQRFIELLQTFLQDASVRSRNTNPTLIQQHCP